jgi:hypothetical protein
LAWATRRFRLPTGTHSPIRVISRRPLCAARFNRRPHLRPPECTEAIGQGSGTTGELVTTGIDGSLISATDPPLLRFASLRHTSAASRIARGGRPPDLSRFGVCSALAVFDAFARSMRRRSNWRTCGVGRSVTFQVIEKTRIPVVFESAVRVSAVQPPFHLSRSRPIQPSRALPLQSGRPIAGHAPSAIFDVAFRYSATGLPQPCRTIEVKILLPCVSRPAALLGFRPFAGLLPRMGEPASLPLGPTCRSRASRPPRLIFVGVTRFTWPGCDARGD